MKLFWKIAGFLVTIVLAVGIVGAVVAGGYILKISADLPDYEKLANYRPPITTRVHAGDGTLIAEYARERRLFVPIESIPPQLAHAFISAEDKNFYTHPGVDFMGVLRAAIANVHNHFVGRRPEGASTITQQVAKNFLLSNEVSYTRKLKEALLSFRIEKAYSKDRILELYLNEIYLGNASYGVAAAALNYFDKSLSELTLAQMAYLATLPKAPNNYNPVTKKAAAVARRNWVLDRMAENGYVDRADAKAAQAEDLVARARPMGAQLQVAKYFAEEVRREVYGVYGEQSLYDGGLSIRTSLDLDLQRVATKALRDGLEAYDSRHGWRGPVTHVELEDWQKSLDGVSHPHDIVPWRLCVVLDMTGDGAEIGFDDGSRGHLGADALTRPKASGKPLEAGDVVYVAPGKEDGTFELRQIPAVNGGVVVMDPHTGRVLALVGGFSYDMSVFNRATQAHRQTGSAFKPFVYAAALDHGYTPSSIVLDAPFVIDQGPGLGIWRPQNYDEGEFFGPSTLRLGVEKSRNTMTVRLASTVGMDVVADYAKRFGIIDDMPHVLSMAIGAGETTLLRLTTAYSMLVNGGKRITPTLIDRIQDRDGKTIYKHDQAICDGCNAKYWANQEEPLVGDTREQVIDSGTAYQIVSILEGVVRRGTGTIVRSVDRPLAGKTGTTNDQKDAWFVGFSPDLTVGVYVGYDTPKNLGHGETGGHVAAPVFRDIMQAAIGDKPAVPFRIPPNIRLVRINLKTGLATGPDDPKAILEAYKPGTGPETGGGEVLDGSDPSLSNAAATVDDEGNPLLPTSVAPASSTTIRSGTGGLY